MKKYEKQAQDFLNRTKTTLEINFKGYKPHFTKTNKPSSYDILAYLGLGELETFNDFCDNFGYNNDSMKAMKVYNAVQDEIKGLQALYNEKEMELLQEIN